MSHSQLRVCRQGVSPVPPWQTSPPLLPVEALVPEQDRLGGLAGQDRPDRGATTLRVGAELLPDDAHPGRARPFWKGDPTSAAGALGASAIRRAAGVLDLDDLERSGALGAVAAHRRRRPRPRARCRESEPVRDARLRPAPPRRRAGSLRGSRSPGDPGRRARPNAAPSGSRRTSPSIAPPAEPAPDRRWRARRHGSPRAEAAPCPRPPSAGRARRRWRPGRRAERPRAPRHSRQRRVAPARPARHGTRLRLLRAPAFVSAPWPRRAGRRDPYSTCVVTAVRPRSVVCAAAPATEREQREEE